MHAQGNAIMGPRDLERYKRLLLAKLDELSVTRTEAESSVLRRRSPRGRSYRSGQCGRRSRPSGPPASVRCSSCCARSKRPWLGSGEAHSARVRSARTFSIAARIEDDAARTTVPKRAGPCSQPDQPACRSTLPTLPMAWAFFWEAAKINHRTEAGVDCGLPDSGQAVVK